MNSQTTEKLYQMKMGAMAEAFCQQISEPSSESLGFEERFAMCVEKEWYSRQNRKTNRRLKGARFKLGASAEDIDYRHPRGLDKSVMRSLLTCRWIDSRHNIILTGPTGSGKSYLAEALAQKACREGYTALFMRLPVLQRELTISHMDGSYSKLMTRIAKLNVLVIDDWGLAPLTMAERRDLLEIMEDRYGQSSTIFTSQYPVSKWHEIVGEATIADAILDRIVHNSHKIELKGDSKRRETSQKAIENLTQSVQSE